VKPILVMLLTMTSVSAADFDVDALNSSSQQERLENAQILRGHEQDHAAIEATLHRIPEEPGNAVKVILIEGVIAQLFYSAGDHTTDAVGLVATWIEENDSHLEQMIRSESSPLIRAVLRLMLTTGSVPPQRTQAALRRLIYSEESGPAALAVLSKLSRPSTRLRESVERLAKQASQEEIRGAALLALTSWGATPETLSIIKLAITEGGYIQQQALRSIRQLPVGGEVEDSLYEDLRDLFEQGIESDASAEERGAIALNAGLAANAIVDRQLDDWVGILAGAADVEGVGRYALRALAALGPRSAGALPALDELAVKYRERPDLLETLRQMRLRITAEPDRAER